MFAENIDKHNAEWVGLNCSDEKVLLNPKEIFDYLNVKFITLDALLSCKKRRGEEKDLIDVDMIDNFVAIEASGQSLITGISVFLSQVFVNNRCYHKSSRRTEFLLRRVLSMSSLLTRFTLLLFGRDKL